MDWFLNLKIRLKVLSLAVIFTFISLVIGFIALNKLGAVNDATNDIQDRYAPVLKYDGDLLVQLAKYRQKELLFITEKDAAVRSEVSGTMKSIASDINKTVNATQPLVQSDDEKSAFDSLKSDVTTYLNRHDTILSLAGQDKAQTALTRALSDSAQDYSKITDDLKSLSELCYKNLTQDNIESDAIYASGKWTLAITILFGIALTFILGKFVAERISKPLTDIVRIAEKIVVGDTSVTLNIETHEEIGELARVFNEISESMRRQAAIAEKVANGDLAVEVNPRSEKDVLGLNLKRMTGTLRSLVQEIARLTQAAKDGVLNVRGDEAAFYGGFKDVVAGVNATIDGFLKPMNEAMTILQRITVNDFTKGMEGSYAGELSEFAASVNTAQGRLLSVQDVFIKLADGDFSRLPEFEKVGKRSENDMMMPAATRMMQTVMKLNQEIENLAQNVSNGNLIARVNPDLYGGAYRELLQKTNMMVESVAAPLDEVMALSKRFTLNDFSTSMSENYKGSYNEIAIAFNSVNEKISLMAKTAENIALGDLKDYEWLSKIGKRSENDRIVPAFCTMIESIQRLIDETDALTHAAVDGRLEARGDLSKHQKAFRLVIQGFNNALDAFAKPIDEASDILHKIAGRDLTARMTGEYKGDFAKIKESLNAAIENLDDGLQQIAVGADQVSTASVEISSGSQSLSQATSEQASSLEEISSSLQEMASMTRQNTANAKEARSLADGARIASDKGRKSMDHLSLAMDRIKSSSDETAKIVKTIDEIAFQTNLLALNAAVEAARAGDAGKGFAVVAEEVRNLAMRSAEAAKSTSSMIETAVKSAEEGVVTNREATENLVEISEQTNRVSEVMAEIAAASDQQNQGIDQVTTAVSQLDELTQQNAASAEESASSAEELSSQAEEMLSMAGSFQLSRSGRLDNDSMRKSFGGSRGASVSRRMNGSSNGHKNGHGDGRSKSALLVRPALSEEPGKVIPFDDDGDSALQDF